MISLLFFEEIRMKLLYIVSLFITFTALGHPCERDLYSFFDAVKDNNILTVSTLLSSSCKDVINICDEALGKTALIFAVERGYTNMVAMLLKNGADPLLAVDKSIIEIYNNNLSKIPLIIAVERNYKEIVKLLLDYYPALCLHEKYRDSLDIYDKETGKSALIIAIEHNNPEIITLLLDYQANPNVRVGGGDYHLAEKTALIVAIEYGFTDIVKLLLKYHANYNLRDIKYKENYRMGNTALKYAIDKASLLIVKELIDAGADIKAYQTPYVKNQLRLLGVRNLSLLAYAICTHAPLYMIKMLINAGAHNVKPDLYGKLTYKQIALLYKYPKVLLLLK